MQRILCKYCNQFFGNCGIGLHMKAKHNISYIEYANENNIQLKPSWHLNRYIHNEIIYDENSKILCKYGCDKIAKWKLKNGTWSCSKFTSQCDSIKIKNSTALKLINRKTGYKHSHHKGHPSPSKGKTYEELFGDRAAEIKLKISMNTPGKCRDLLEERKRRERISVTAKKNGLSGGHRHGSGRGKKGWYKGYWCDSSYELAWIIYNLEHDLTFERNNKTFPYYYNGIIRNWRPDFIQNGKYVEIKGWVTKQTGAKISQFTDSIEILTKKKLRNIFDYVITKYGKNYISLYNQGEVPELGLTEQS